MTVRTYSLAEVAAQVLPSEWTDSERWLRRRLNRGEIRGYRVGREWRMTESHVEALVQRYCNGESVQQPEPTTSFAAGLSAQSRRRLRRVS